MDTKFTSRYSTSSHEIDAGANEMETNNGLVVTIFLWSNIAIHTWAASSIKVYFMGWSVIGFLFTSNAIEIELKNHPKGAKLNLF